MNSTQQKNLLIAAGIIFIAILSRFIPPYNFTAVGAIGLFGAAHFKNKWLAFVLPFAALWLSDLFLSNVIHAQFYDSFQWFNNGYVYVGFAAIIVIGMILMKKVNNSNVLISAIVVSLAFFLITNFGFWLTGTLYPKTSVGLGAAMIAGIPFFWSTLAGNVFYSFVLFKLYDWIKVSETSEASIPA